MKIVIVGTGYVGLVTGACFAHVGIHVVCVDKDERKIQKLKSGGIPIYEPGLEDIVKKNSDNGRLSFSLNLEESLQGAEVVFLAVGTPSGEDGSADLQYVLNVAQEIGRYAQHHLLVVVKSTVPVGTSQKVQQAIDTELSKRNVSFDFDIASNPEFLREGVAVDDFLKPDRIVCGTNTDRAKEILKKLYHPFLLNNHPVIFMDTVSSELTKYAANAFLATKISYMNEISRLCEKVGADIRSVRDGIGSDNRIMYKFLYAGTGYGGSCFPKDVKALIKTASDAGSPLSILESVEQVNESQKEILFRKAHAHFNGELSGKRIAIWGLAFKPNTDDMREAPALSIIRKLLDAGATVLAYDPVAMNEAQQHYLGDTITYGQDKYEILENADALFLVTEWHDFRILDFDVISEKMKTPVLFDGRNIYDGQQCQDNGITYYGIGV